MELTYKGSFFRDLDKISNRYLLQAVKKKIKEIQSAKSPLQISSLKKFRSLYRIWYKIEIQTEQNNKIYWILCTIKNNAVEFRRIKTEQFFKNNY